MTLTKIWQSTNNGWCAKITQSFSNGIVDKTGVKETETRLIGMKLNLSTENAAKKWIGRNK